MRRLLFTLGFAALAYAQSDLHRNNFTAGIGAAIPVGQGTRYLTTAPLVSFGYGYRFNRFLQADAGFQIAFGAAHNQGAVLTEIGPLQGGDHEYMIPLGGRLIIPSRLKRVELSAGGGAVYLHYSETVPSNGDFTVNCYSCSSRAGWGAYGLASVRYFMDDNRNFHLGTTAQFISASTNGQAVGNVPGIKTTDRWTNISFEIGLSF